MHINKLVIAFFSGLVFLLFSSLSFPDQHQLAAGSQPQVSVDVQGHIRIAFGLDDKIFCAESTDEGISFSKPVLVATVPSMHLGMSRGPQIASSANYSMITAIDKQGDIHCYRLNHSGGKWIALGLVNDLKGSAPEGLMGISADNKDNFYAVWQDNRADKHNKIYFSTITGKATKWSTNRLAYKSPDGTVCECCKPNIAVKGNEVAIMFRNWLLGSRDLYVLQSADKGKTFGEAKKLGTETWKLNGCPMDGGGIMIDPANQIHTTWQRKGTIYYAGPGKAELYIAAGRNCGITGQVNNISITYQNNDTVKMMALKTKKETIIGRGSFVKEIALPNNSMFFTWEQDNKIKFRKI
jgi:hypothetical protein